MKKHLFLKSLLIAIGLLVTGLTTQVWANSDHTFSGGWLYFDNNNIKANDGNNVSYWVVSGGTAYFNIYGGTGTGSGYNCGSQTLEYLSGSIYRVTFPTGKCDTWQLVRGSDSNCSTKWNHTYADNAANFDNGKNFFGCSDGNYYYAYAAYNAVVYWDNSAAGWTDNKKQLLIGRTNKSFAYDLTQIPNTNIYYNNTALALWTNYTEYAFIGVSSSWGEYNQTPSSRKSSATHRTNVRSEGLEGHHFYSYTSGTTNDRTLPKTDLSSYSDMDRTITIGEKYNASGTTPWADVDSDNSLGTITASGNKFDSWTTCAGSSSCSITKETATYSANADFGYTSTVTLTAGATKAGKAFVGWYRSNGTLISTNTETTITVTGNETVYAHYKNEVTHDVTVSYMCSSSSIKSGATESAVGVTTTRSVTAPDIDHYEFVEWTHGDGVTVSSTTAKTITINSVADQDEEEYYLTANYKYMTRFYFHNAGNWSKVYAYMWKESGTANASYPGVEITSKTKTVACGTRYYYDYDASSENWDQIIFNEGSGDGKAKTGDLSIEGNADHLFVWTNSGDAKGTWYNLDNHTVSVATEASYKGTVSGGGTANYGCSTTITATPNPGYRFDSWTVSSGTATIANASNETTTVTATSDATITARFNQNKIIYFDNSMSRWDDSNGIWVYLFDNNDGVWWNDEVNGGVHPGVHRAEYGQMTRIGSSNIYYYKYSTNNTITGVAFAKADQHDNTAFYQTSAAWITSFPTCLPCYIASDNYMSKNSTGYHSYGYWKRWGNTNSGYTLYYQDGSNPEQHIDFTTEDPESSIYTATVTLSSSNSNYNYNVARCSSANKLRRADYNGDIQDSDSDYPRELSDAANANGRLRTSAAGEYKFTLSLATNHIMMTVEYPLSVGDYRVRLMNASKNHESGRIIRARSESKTDTISFFIDHTKSNVLYVDTCTNTGNPPRWNRISDVSAATLSLTSEPYTTKTGVYKFGITRTKNKNVALSLLAEPEYDGKYYVRTDAADGKWIAYMSTDDNLMHYTSKSLDNPANFDYYFVKAASSGTNVHFTVANDYSPCISDTLKDDFVGNSGNLQANANVRYAWNSKTNTLSRAFLNASVDCVSQRLVLQAKNDSIKNKDDSSTGKEGSTNWVSFNDMGNWVFQRELKAEMGTHVRLLSNYYFSSTNHDQYFRGTSDATWNPTTTMQLLGGTGSSFQTLRLIYDFKTDEFEVAWIPENATNLKDELPIYTDMLLIRRGQHAANQITFNGGSITNIKKIVGAIELRYDDVVGHVSTFTTGSDAYRYLMYYISLPFDVAVEDIYGFGQLNKEWYLQYYDGAERAKKGFFRGDGTTSFWKFMTAADTLKANVGYSLLLDNDYFNTNAEGTVWHNKSTGDKIYLYFPAMKDLKGTEVIKSGDADVKLPAHEHTSGRTFTTESGRTVSHNFTDSHWNMMGIPLFQNKTGVTAGTFVTSGVDSTTAFATDNGYFFEWDTVNNALNVRSTADYVFKPMHGYMVQYSGTVTFTGSSIQPASLAARRAPIKENYALELQLLQNDQRVSRTYIELRDEACDTFALNEDVYMIYTSLPADLFTYAGNYDVSANVLSVKNHTIPVGVEVHQAGSYTFTMPRNFSGAATLVDTQTGTRTNLALSDYTVSLPKGVCDGRFYIDMDIHKTPTAIDGVEDGSGSLKDGKAHKFIENGQMYILKNGMIYNAQGAKVK